MENETQVIEIKYKNMYTSICITQTVCVVVILIAVLIIKFFFNSSYLKLKDWYEQNVLEETTITAAFDEDKQ